MQKAVKVLLWIGIVVLSLSACVSSQQTGSDRVSLKKVRFSDLDHWQDDDQGTALSAFRKSCQKMMALPKDRPLHVSGIGGKIKDWQSVCRRAMRTPLPQARSFFESYFTPYHVEKNDDTKGLFTGYYEIGLYGSRKRHGAFQNPVYKRPRDLSTDNVYYKRSEIEAGILDGKHLELLWLNDPVMVFFLHIQGSGLVQLDDGTTTRIGYDGKNNHPYTALGRYMLDQEWLRKGHVSAQTIKEWLFDHPYYGNQVMNENASYIFFRELTGRNGPIGAQGVELTPKRSLAIDNHYIPYGVPIWLDTQLTANEHEAERRFAQLMIAQDTGGAIRGKVRGDIFFGAGDEAQEQAGVQNASGQYYLLLPH